MALFANAAIYRPIHVYQRSDHAVGLSINTRLRIKLHELVLYIYDIS